MKESGCTLEHPSAAQFRTHVLAGNWDKVSSAFACVDMFFSY